jgi:hypothetical protein
LGTGRSDRFIYWQAIWARDVTGFQVRASAAAAALIKAGDETGLTPGQPWCRVKGRKAARPGVRMRNHDLPGIMMVQLPRPVTGPAAAEPDSD